MVKIHNRYVWLLLASNKQTKNDELELEHV